ncbi:MAG TPA: nitrile hydratase accessory protein [Roseiarcus sp.]|nr:nitrile hydratase accessory protein [Roseiarcus sp.]
MNPPEPKVFTEPWHAQVFAMVLALHERGLFSWREWTAALSAEIARFPERGSYENWLEALEGLIAGKGAATREELAALAQAWLEAAEATPHGQPIVLGARSGAP